MEPSVLNIVAKVLQHHSIAFAFVDETALSSRVRHDIKVCVPLSSLQAIADMLVATGLFQRANPDSFNLYTEYRRGMLRLATTGWLALTQFVCLFPSDFFQLVPLETFPAAGGQPCYYISDHILAADGLRECDVLGLARPRLPHLIVCYARQTIDEKDDTAIVAGEQLVDRMDIDES